MRFTERGGKMEKAKERQKGTEGESDTLVLLLHKAINTFQSQIEPQWKRTALYPGIDNLDIRVGKVHVMYR